MNSELLPRDGRILCAVSGGVDSMYLMCRLRELGYDVAAAHYNHGLRGDEADRDEAFVRAFCEREQIPFLSEKGDVAAFAKEARMGLEEAARALRYAFLERAADTLGAAVIATAHTADDNAETLLLHLARGTGLRGLGGIPPRRGRIVRPMLDVTRDEAEAYLTRCCIPHVEDSTNARDDYARNRVRHGAVPALETVNPAFVRAVGRTAALLREDETFLSGLAADFIRQYGSGDSVPAKALAALPGPVAARVVMQMAGRDLSAVHVQAVLKAAAHGGGADIPGLRVERTDDRLVFGASDCLQIMPQTLTIPGRIELRSAGWAVTGRKLTACPHVVHNTFNIFYFNCANICGSIKVTGRVPGDKFRPVGRGCTKALRRLLEEKNVPRWERDGVPVLRDEAGVLGICGIGAAERAWAKPGDTDIIEIEFIRLLPDKERG